jgi:serine/threonine protein kinase
MRSVTSHGDADWVDPDRTAYSARDVSLSRRPTRPDGNAQVEYPVAGGVSEIGPGYRLNARYEIRSILGAGGMGAVYGAVDLRKMEARNPNPWVAVKLLHADFSAHPDSFVALEREASKSQKLAHPNIATVFDFDRDGDTVFLSMELLRGRSLHDITREARTAGMGIGRDKALPIIRGIAQGLAYAHQKGVVHLDLKPANVFILEDGTPKILDFGIARLVPGAGDGPRDEFDAGSLRAYSEFYATEEMVAGIDPAPADDLYALGLIACELLYGKHPFGTSAALAKAAHLRPPQLAELGRTQRRALLACLAFERRARPRDAAEFLRIFDGARPLRNALFGAVALLTVVASYFSYVSYLETGPLVAFEQLPRATQAAIRQHLEEGERLWQFYKHDHIGDALASSVEEFAAAYAMHEGNRDAVRGLRRAADETLKLMTHDMVQRRQQAEKLVAESKFFGTYGPVQRALASR